MEKQQITLEVPYNEQISRLFVFRFLWGIPLWFVMAVWSIWIGLIGCIHLLYQLVLGKRHRWMWEQTRIFFIFSNRWNAYFSLLVDKKPELVETEL